MAGNLLDIVTKVDRPTITIDGTHYEMCHPNELSMKDFHLLMKRVGQLENLGNAYSADPEAAMEKIAPLMSDLVDQIVPGIPDEVRDKLNPYHVQQIAETFIGLSRIDAKPGERPNRKKSSRGSSASTAAARKAG